MRRILCAYVQLTIILTKNSEFMRKHFLAFFVLLLAAMNIQFVNAAIVKTFAVDKSGLFSCRCEYDTETEKCKVILQYRRVRLN